MKCGKKGKVVAFEPDPEAWVYLKDNIKESKYNNIKIHNIALSDHKGKGMMKLNGRGQLYQDEVGNNKDTNTVKLITFEEIWSKLSWDTIDLIKIDVEGAELSVLKGMEKIIKKYHPHLIIEIHPDRLEKYFNSTAMEVYEFLKEHSYKLTPVDKKTLDIPKDDNITVWADYKK